ncbi:hypothetical protein AGMMS49992_19680 [Clostridia bacterium]|nr:hypothetical protein AGMMS49992_19680 [Clostridia bacterium]
MLSAFIFSSLLIVLVSLLTAKPSNEFQHINILVNNRRGMLQYIMLDSNVFTEPDYCRGLRLYM